LLLSVQSVMLTVPALLLSIAPPPVPLARVMVSPEKLTVPLVVMLKARDGDGRIWLHDQPVRARPGDVYTVATVIQPLQVDGPGSVAEARIAGGMSKVIRQHPRSHCQLNCRPQSAFAR
jgi:hypothetical protein